LFRTSVLIEQGKVPQDVAIEVEAWLQRFPELYTQFVSIFCRLYHQNGSYGELSLQNLATLIALRAHLQTAVKARLISSI
jgi:hypothetical protein